MMRLLKETIFYFYDCLMSVRARNVNLYSLRSTENDAINAQNFLDVKPENERLILVACGNLNLKE